MQVPSGVDGNSQGYALFTWDSIGIIDQASMIAITHEAWVRQPIIVTRSPWTSLGLMSDPAAAVNIDGRLEVFARGADAGLWHKWQTSAGGSWSNRAPLGIINQDTVLELSSDPIVEINLDGRLEVFSARGGQRAVAHLADLSGWRVVKLDLAGRQTKLRSDCGS